MTTDDERLARISGEIFDAALDRGYLVHHVPADAASVLHLDQPWSYTVGRTLMERSEFLVTGLPPDIAESVLDALVMWDDETGLGEAAAGAFVSIELIGRIKLIRADTAPLLGAINTFGLDKVVAMQALWPRAGGYPSENERWPDQPIHPYGRTPLVGRDPYATEDSTDGPAPDVPGSH